MRTVAPRLTMYSCHRRPRTSVAALTMLLCGAVTHTAVAAHEVVDEIVVVANKEPRPVRDVAAAVTVINRDELDDNLATSVSDVLRYVPGIDQETAGTRFGEEGVNIRGIGGNRVAVLVDGVPLNDQFDVGSFSNATRDFLNAGLLQRIEVLRGPASALYGSNAIGGVIAAATPDPADIAARRGTGGRLRSIWHDADNSLQVTALLALDADGTGLMLGGSVQDGSESASAAVPTSLDSRDILRRSALAKLVVDNVHGQTWRFGVMHQEASVNSTLNALLGSGRYRSTTALEGDDEYRMQLVSAAWEFGAPDGFIENGALRAYYHAADTRQETLDERGNAARPVSIDRLFHFEQATYGAELNLHRTISAGSLDHRLGAGLEFSERKTEEYRDGLEHGMEDGIASNVILGEVFPLRDFPTSISREWGAYLEDVMSVGDWSFILALRADRYELRPQDDAMYAEDYPFATPISLTESDLSPKLGIMYQPGDRIDYYLQYSHGFRAPPFEDANIGLEIPAFNYRAVPNPELRSESSDGIELGIRWRSADLRLHTAVFRTHYDDFIESRVQIGTDPASGRVLFQAQNLQHAVITGVEAGFEWQVPGDRSGDLSIDGSLYLARGENRDTHEPLNSVGPAQLVAGIAWQAPNGRRGLRLQATHTAAWSDHDESAGPLFRPDASTVLDLYLSQAFGERVTVRAGVLNLTDVTWWHWSSVRGLPAGDVLIPHLAQPGRNVALSVGLDW